MTTDVDVQYFSHLNGLVLANNWGDMIRLLDTCLVNGLPLTSITSASIDAQGDITLNLYAAHNCMLFQIIELTGFAPSELNGKYRLKGIPTATQLILKATHTGKTITTVGAAKLASLGYDIVFRDIGDVKRVYRAKNPSSQHPFIRVDASLTSPDSTSGVYNSNYNMFVMVGLLEQMEHIDDFQNSEVIQLPFDPIAPTKNWDIIGTGGSVVRGWARWYYASRGDVNYTYADTGAPEGGRRPFTLVGDSNSFQMVRNTDSGVAQKGIIGCGLFRSADSDGALPWFLAASLNNQNAFASRSLGSDLGGLAVWGPGNSSNIFMLKSGVYDAQAHVTATAIVPDSRTGYTGIYNGTAFAALEVPFFDQNKVLRGVVPNILYLGVNFASKTETSSYLSGSSMYVIDSVQTDGPVGSTAFYLGELE